MNNIVSFIKDSYAEVKDNVTWPAYGELQNNTILVLVASLIFALAIGAMDGVFQQLMQLIYEA